MSYHPLGGVTTHDSCSLTYTCFGSTGPDTMAERRLSGNPSAAFWPGKEEQQALP